MSSGQPHGNAASVNITLKDGLLGLIEQSSIQFVLTSSRYPPVRENACAFSSSRIF